MLEVVLKLKERRCAVHLQTIQHMEPAWHGYTVCNGFCPSDNVSRGSTADCRYTDHPAVAVTTERPGCRAIQLGIKRRSRSEYKPKILGVGGGNGHSSRSLERSASEERSRGRNQQENSEPCSCTFLVSASRQKLQELVKRLLSKNPSNRPTALKYVFSTLGVAA